MNGPATSLTVTGLTAGYARREVIRDLDLDSIRPGQLSALVGPNGAGKSTLLRAIAGLLPARGSVRVGDRELIGASARERARCLTFMPQTVPLGVGLTVFEATLSALRASPIEDLQFASTRAVHERVMDTLDRIGIADLAMQPLDHLSGGERQLASLGQSLVRGPRVLLLDEPTSALDLRHQVTVMHLARDVAADGRIVLAVLHDLNLAARWAHHIVVLNRGAVDCAGTPADALTPAVLARVYGVQARVERDASGAPAITVDGLVRQ